VNLFFLQGVPEEEAKVTWIIESLKDGRLTLDQYLFGFHDDHCLRLQDLCNVLRSSSTKEPIPLASFLSAHPERPLSLDELLKIFKGDLHVQGSIQRQSISSLRAKLSLLPTQHADRSSCLLYLADALYRRYSQWAQKDDLEEAIWSYKEALSLIPNSHYYYLEALLGLCSSLYQRYYLLGHADDLENLLWYLDLQCDVLNRRRSLLAPVEVQLCLPPPTFNVIDYSHPVQERIIGLQRFMNFFSDFGRRTMSVRSHIEQDPSLQLQIGSSLFTPVTSSPTPPATPPPSLIVSDTILGTFYTSLILKLILKSLGYGSHGTIVFQGPFQGRAVAIKRFNQSFATLATREISILQQSDDHPNVIRYYYQESKPDLCPASLVDIIEGLRGDGGRGFTKNRREEWKKIMQGFDAKRAMRQIARGLRHLHGLGLIHRDIKPQNILISSSSSSEGRGGMGHRMLISDFGLCKKLDVDQSSFLPAANDDMAPGTVGWRAPEVLRGEYELLTGDDSTSSREGVATITGDSCSSGTTTPKTRLTKSVDIFVLGCLFYYILTHGGHPYGERFEPEVNFIKDEKGLSLPLSTEESTEALDLITCMLHPQPSQRPDIKTCLLHPFFCGSNETLGILARRVG